MTVLCLVEEADGQAADVSLRALTFARQLAGSSGQTVAAAVFGDPDAVPAEVLSGYGVSDAYAIWSPQTLAGYAPQAWARALAGLSTGLPATAVVAAGTDRGRRCWPTSARSPACRWPPTASPRPPTGPAGGSSSGIAGRAACWRTRNSRRRSPCSPWRRTPCWPSRRATPAHTSVHRCEPALSDADLVVRAAESAEQSAGVSLATARVVVGGGRGVGGPEGFAPLEELAGLLGGVLGVSRVVTSEGWRPHKQQVGQTGTRISPELYLACGISGAIQHMAGCLSARHIVAVNTDAEAPIIAHADYAVIGDLNEVIPALVTAIRARDGAP